MTGVHVVQALMPVVVLYLLRTQWSGRPAAWIRWAAAASCAATLVLVAVLAPQMLSETTDDDDMLLGGLINLAILLAIASAVLTGWLHGRSAQPRSPFTTGIGNLGRAVFAWGIAAACTLGWVTPFMNGSYAIVGALAEFLALLVVLLVDTPP